MRREVFDQDRPRSAKAQQLAEAFAGCEEWTLVPPRRRSTLPEPTPITAAQPQSRFFDFEEYEEERRAA